MMHEHESVHGLPSGLCACRYAGENVHIHALSPRSITLRLPRPPLSDGALTLHLYRPEAGAYEVHTIPGYTAGPAQPQQGAVLVRFCFDDPACAAAIRRTLNAYARYLETKSTLGAAAYAQEITAYPAEGDEIFPASLQEARRAWFIRMKPLPQPDEGISLAVALNCPELWRMYLDLPLREFMAAYACARQLPPDFLPRRLPDRLYLGSGHCRFLFPDASELAAITAKAAAEGLSLTLTTAELICGHEAGADSIIDFAAKHALELEVNDWGMLQRAAGRANILLGPRLNRRRKDPRMLWKAGMKPELLRQNALNSTPWLDFLKEHGAVRFEYESCCLPAQLPDAPCSLHLPFYQTNASRWCPLQALCARGDRGSQQPADSCPCWCETNVLLYPEHLAMVGRWNALLALDSQPCTAGYDRWVLNF